jgi:hydrogenase maturation protease
VDAHAGPLSAGSPHRSTHDLGLADIVELGRVLGRLPPRLVILGIEVADCAPGAGLSPAVQRGLRRAVRRALAALAGQDVRRPPVAIREPAGSSALP